METRPSDEALAAAVGAPGQQVKKVSGGPYFWRFECGGRVREVLVLDGQVAPKAMTSVGRYLQSVGMLDHKTMTRAELMHLLSTYGELPKDFDYRPGADPSYFMYGPPPGLAEHPVGLTYGTGGATLVLYAIEPQAEQAWPAGAPRPPNMRGGGAIAQVNIRAILHIGRDYQLKWLTDRYNESTKQWESR
jgi:hypothetical protein